MPIASSWSLDSHAENGELLNQFKSKLLRAHEPGCAPFDGKALTTRRVGSPGKKLGVAEKKIQAHITSANTLSSKSATGF